MIEYSKRIKRSYWVIRAGSVAVAVLGMVVVAVACVERKPLSCQQSGGGYCQGTVMACGVGWGSVTVGQKCAQSAVQQSDCYTWTSCAPGACGSVPGGYLPTGCASAGGQCCFCKTLVAVTPSGNWFVEYDRCNSCNETPPSTN